MASSDTDEDRRERDKFAERLKRKDKDRTRNIAIPRSDKKAYEEAAKRLKLENEREKEMVIPRLRIESRRKYLEKRKDDKVTELEADIIDDEYLFDTEDLSQREIFDREHKKKLLSLAKEHEKARELENVQRYRMPQDIKDDQMQYELEVDKTPVTEQQKWEEEQMSSAVYKFGAKRQEKEKEQYELLIDNQIEFIQTANLPGTRDDEKPEVTEKQKKKT